MAVRRAQRPGGAALQLDVLAFSTAVDNSRLPDGRFKGALESMMQCALRPEAEIAAAAPPSTGDARIQEAAKIRLSLVTGKNRLDDSPAKTTTTTSSSTTTTTSSSSTTPTVGEGSNNSTTPPEIPFILDISRCEIGSSGCRFLAPLLAHKACQRLVFLDLSSNIATDLAKEFSGIADVCDSLSTLPKLTFLSLHNNLLLASGCEAVCKLLRRTKSLKYLDLSRCNVGIQGAAALLPAFRRPRTSTTTTTATTTTSTSSSSSSSSSSLSSEAKESHNRNDDMDDIYKTNDGEGDEEEEEEEDDYTFDSADRGVSSSSSSTRRPRPPTPENPNANTSLVWLDLSENNLCGFGGGTGSRGYAAGEKQDKKQVVVSLVAGLMRHPRLISLDLSRNRLTREVVDVISDHLEGHRTLQFLELEENGIDAAPAARLAASLVNNDVMTKISLRANRLRSDGASAFADLLRRTTTVKYLDLRGNYIGMIGQADMKLALAGLPPPPEVSAYGNTNSGTSSGGMGPLEDTLEGNGSQRRTNNNNSNATARGNNNYDNDDADEETQSSYLDEDVMQRATSSSSSITGSSRPPSAATTADVDAGSVDTFSRVPTSDEESFYGNYNKGAAAGAGGNFPQNSNSRKDPGTPTTHMSSDSRGTGGGRGGDGGGDGRYATTTSTSSSRPATTTTEMSDGAAAVLVAPLEPGSLEYYAEMKFNDDDDEDENEDDGSGRRAPPIIGTSNSSSSSSSSGSNSNAAGASAVSPSRASGSGIRAVMALRSGPGGGVVVVGGGGTTSGTAAASTSSSNSSSTTTTPEVSISSSTLTTSSSSQQPPQQPDTNIPDSIVSGGKPVLLGEDGAWVDSIGRRVFVVSEADHM